MTTLKRPKEIKSSIKNIKKENGIGKQVFSVEQYLSMVEENPEGTEDIPSALTMFSKKSIFRFTILEKFNSLVESVYANIPIEQLPTITKRTEYMTGKLMESEVRTKENGVIKQNDANSPAYTKVIKIGKIKNKTPVQVLMEDIRNISVLEEVARWLKEKMDMQPNSRFFTDNKEQYDAIVEAIHLANTNSLQIQNNNLFVPRYKIYEAPIRTLSKSRSDKKKFVYGICIDCCPGREYPYEIKICNYWADCDGIRPRKGSISDYKEKTVLLSEDVWDDTIAQMNMIKSLFIEKYGKYELARAEDAYDSIRKKYN